MDGHRLAMIPNEKFKIKAEGYSDLDVTLRSQFATLEIGRGRHRNYLPLAFSEHGAVMLASVLSSHVAIEASIRVRRFVP